jgi:hypothetical protein
MESSQFPAPIVIGDQVSRQVVYPAQSVVFTGTVRTGDGAQLAQGLFRQYLGRGIVCDIFHAYEKPDQNRLEAVGEWRRAGCHNGVLPSCGAVCSL